MMPTFDVFRGVGGDRILNDKVWQDFTPPKGYEFHEAGDGPVTKRALALAGQRPVYRVRQPRKCRGYARTLGYFLPKGVYKRAADAVARERGDETEWRRKLETERANKQKREIEQFRAAIIEQFPSIPPEEAQQIAAHACETGSGRVGRSRVADDPVLLAVRAHARHAHTEYDDMLAFGWEREEAREHVRPVIEDILQKWRQCPAS